MERVVPWAALVLWELATSFCAENTHISRRPLTAISLAMAVYAVFPLAYAAEPVLSAAARAHLDEAIGAIRAEALNADQVDWDALKPKREALADGAVTPAETYLAIRAARSALNDHHSQLAAPESVQRALTSNDATGFGQASQSLGPVAISPCRPTPACRPPPQRLADELQQRLADRRTAGACGFVIDLRRDHGGDMFSMIAGLAPLFADGLVGSFVGRHGETGWHIETAAYAMPETRSDMLSRTRWTEAPCCR